MGNRDDRNNFKHCTFNKPIKFNGSPLAAVQKSRRNWILQNGPPKAFEAPRKSLRGTVRLFTRI